MPQMDEVSFNNEKTGTYNPSFSLQENTCTYVHKDLPPCRGPTPPSTAAAPDTSFIPTEAICSPVILNNVSPPIKISSSLISHPTVLDVSPADMAKADAPPPENLGSQTQPHDAAQNPTEASEGPTQPHTTPVPTEITGAPTITPLLQTAPTDPVNSVIDPSSPPSSLIDSCSDTHTASVETDTPPDPSYAHGEAASPLELPPYPKQTSTPPPTPEHAPSKGSLVHLDTSPLDTPPRTDAPCQVDQPSTSLSDQTDPSGRPEGAADTVSPSQQRRPSSNSGNTQDSRREGEVDDDGFLGDEDKNSEDDDELEPDEEELLRVLARLHPTFISFSK